MAQGEGFKHITVTAAEDEDVVIFAGAVTEGDSEMLEPTEAGADVPQAVEEPGPRTEGPDPRTEEPGPRTEGPDPRPEGSDPRPEGSDPRPEGSGPRTEGPDPCHPEGEARRISAKRAASERPEPKDDYHETTLEDLQGTPMPLTQIIVIVAAIVCIIGAVIYYLAFMR